MPNLAPFSPGLETGYNGVSLWMIKNVAFFYTFRSLNGKRIRVSIAKPRMKGARSMPSGGGRNRRCYDCLEFGHLARDCVKGRRRNR